MTPKLDGNIWYGPNQECYARHSNVQSNEMRSVTMLELPTRTEESPSIDLFTHSRLLIINGS